MMQKGNHMNQLQQEEFLILLELDRILKRHNIPYYLYGGTLLGAARHQGFIPWDDDIDIVLTREHFEAIETILSDPANISNGFHYQSAKTTKYLFFSSPYFFLLSAFILNDFCHILQPI